MIKNDQIYDEMIKISITYGQSFLKIYFKRLLVRHKWASRKCNNSTLILHLPISVYAIGHRDIYIMIVFDYAMLNVLDVNLSWLWDKTLRLPLCLTFDSFLAIYFLTSL